MTGIETEEEHRQPYSRRLADGTTTAGQTLFAFSDNPTLNRLLWLAGASILYFCLAKFGMAFISLQPSNITLLWLPSGIAFAMCLAFGPRAAAWIFVASFAANYAGMMADESVANLTHTAISAAIDAAAGVFAATVYTRLLPNGLTRVTHFLPFVLGVAFATGVFTGVLVGLNLVAGGYIAQTDVGQFILMILLADTLGILLVAPICLKIRALSTVSTREWQVFLGISALIVLTLVLFYADALTGAMYMVLPLLLLMSFYVNICLLSIVSLLSLVTIIVVTAGGVGFFATVPNDASYEHMMIFLIATSVTVLGVGIQNQQLLGSQERASSFESAAKTDPLTDLLNRRSFFPLAENEFQAAANRPGHAPFAIAILDLDRFKSVNDTYGHPAGDEVLKQFSKLLRDLSRRGDIAARLGGEEFIILIAECGLEDAQAKLIRLLQLQAAASVAYDDQEIHVTVSAGLSAFEPDDSSLHDIIERADQALYRAKKLGRNRVEIGVRS